jgi:hypothetical protein
MSDEREYAEGGPIPPMAQAVGMGASLGQVAADQWRHRSATMKCRTCMWYVPKVGAGPAVPTRPIGRCRRHAPTMGGYPVVYSDDWCGDHKLDENKP